MAKDLGVPKGMSESPLQWATSFRADSFNALVARDIQPAPKSPLSLSKRIDHPRGGTDARKQVVQMACEHKNYHS